MLACYRLGDVDVSPPETAARRLPKQEELLSARVRLDVSITATRTQGLAWRTRHRSPYWRLFTDRAHVQERVAEGEQSRCGKTSNEDSSCERAQLPADSEDNSLRYVLYNVYITYKASTPKCLQQIQHGSSQDTSYRIPRAWLSAHSKRQTTTSTSSK